MGVVPLIPFFIFGVIKVSAQVQEECPTLFLRYSKDHSYCKPTNPTCNILRSFLTEDDIDTILWEHNNFRSRVATGKEQKLPAASSMLQMEWDDELAAVAQKHANQCLFEHDCSNCRRVQNFGVGQNLAIETISNSPDIPEPNWPSAIKSWYDEVAYFSKNYIDPFVPPPEKPTYGHFSQVVWSNSWRVGCGYVVYTETNDYKKLYVCNYGPAGNVLAESMYKQGQPCTGCPVNSCCDKTCGGTAEYAGLCKITDDRRPTYKPQGSYIFYCDFQNQSDCNMKITGINKWLYYNTLTGNYLGVVQSGGEKSTLVFTKAVKATSSSFCFIISYRSGPNVDGKQEANTATETFVIPSIDNFEVNQNLPVFNGDAKQQFSEFSMALSWNMETEFKLTFSVPPGKPDQFFEIQRIYAKDGPCS